MRNQVQVTATSRWTRLVVTLDKTVVLRGRLPPLSAMRDAGAAIALLEALSRWVDEKLSVALHADDAVSCFRCDLADELERGASSDYYAIDVVKRERKRRVAELPVGGAR